MGMKLTLSKKCAHKWMKSLMSHNAKWLRNKTVYSLDEVKSENNIEF